uniref:(northern house mosquito) hypothetical protein n=1 Tax=Culex pipiens TaxID=7175 RepID=A0A8D8FKF3_CULPI
MVPSSRRSRKLLTGIQRWIASSDLFRCNEKALVKPQLFGETNFFLIHAAVVYNFCPVVYPLHRRWKPSLNGDLSVRSIPAKISNYHSQISPHTKPGRINKTKLLPLFLPQVLTHT